MRFLVLTLALLAGAKVWTQDALFRAGAEEALVAAYRQEAVQACQKHGRAGNWAKASTVRMATGSRNVAVHFWQVDSPLWSARYRNPYLVLSDESGTASCEYDVLYGQAAVSRG